MRYVNKKATPLTDAIFTFEQEGATVYDFNCEIDDKKITVECIPNEDIAGSSKKAITKRDGEFKVNIGSLASNQTCVVSLRYATLLTMKGDSLLLSIPQTALDIDVQNDVPTDDRFTERLSLNIDLAMASPISNVSSDTHLITKEIQGKAGQIKVAYDMGKLQSRRFAMVVDLQSLTSYESPPVSVVEVDRSKEEISRTIAIGYVPRIETNMPMKMEFVFMVDRSGSMAGDNFYQIKNALHLLIRSIPLGSLFNIIGFGSSFDLLFLSSTEYDTKSFKNAIDYIQQLKADFGRTTMMEALNYALLSPINESHPRQIIILSDGKMEDGEKVIASVKKNIGISRIYTLGIGDVNAGFIETLTQLGSGQSETVGVNERVERKATSLLKSAMKPYVSVEFDWTSISTSVIQTPVIIPPIFSDNLMVVFASIPSTVLLSGCTLKVQITCAFNSFTEEVSLSESIHGSSIGALATASRIRDIEQLLDKRKIQESIAKLHVTSMAKRYLLPSQFTSIIVRETRYNPKRKATETRIIENQPTNQTKSTKNKRDNIGEDPKKKFWGSNTSFRAISKKLQKNKVLSSNPLYDDSPNSLDDDFVILGDSSTSTPSLPPPFSSAGHRSVDKFVFLQQFEGNWRMSEEVLYLAGVEIGEIEEIFGKEERQEWYSDIIATSLAVGFLEVTLSEYEDEWQLLHSKALRWILGQLSVHNVGLTVDYFVSSGKQLVSKHIGWI